MSDVIKVVGSAEGVVRVGRIPALGETIQMAGRSHRVTAVHHKAVPVAIHDETAPVFDRRVVDWPTVWTVWAIVTVVNEELEPVGAAHG